MKLLVTAGEEILNTNYKSDQEQDDSASPRQKRSVRYSALQIDIEYTRVYYNRGNFFVYLGCLSHLLVSLFIQLEGRGWCKGGGWGVSLF